MSRPKKNRIVNICGLIGITLATLFLVSELIPDINVNEDYTVKGKYNDSLLVINDLRALINAVDHEILDKKIDQNDKSSIAEIADSLLSFRFYHGTNRYSFTDHYLAYILGKTVWSHFQVVVIPGDLLKGKVTVCSQQQIVFQEVLRHYGFRYRTVNMNVHQATEVFYNDSWHYFDSDYEPDLKDRPGTSQLLSNREKFIEKYRSTRGVDFNDQFQKLLENTKARYSDDGEILALNMRLFHHLLRLFGKFGGFVFLIIFFYFTYFRR